MVNLLSPTIEMEAQRNGVLDANYFAILFAWYPVRHGADDTNGLSIKLGINRFHHCGL